jgi:DNA-binding transcriptional LysR family regulator
MWQKRQFGRQICGLRGKLLAAVLREKRGVDAMTADWDDLRIILALARAGSFKPAAQQLAINESTAVRRLAQAEIRFGIRLFERRRGRLTPTVAGSAIIDRARRIEAEYQSAREEVAGTDRRIAGNVRLTTVPILANHALLPALPALFRLYPDISLELIAEPRRLNLEDREADIALRFARPRSGAHYITRKIADIPYSIYGAAGCDFAALPWIGYEAGMRELPQVSWMAEPDMPTAVDAPPARFAVNDAETLLLAIRNGQGKGYLPSVIGEGQPGLCRLDTARRRQRELWLVVHRDQRRHPRIRAVIRWVVETFVQWGPTRTLSADSSATTAASLAASSGLSSTSFMPAAR